MYEVSDETVNQFMRLFKGRVDAWGTVEGMCVKEPVTIEHYRKHLQGLKSLGIYPLLDDGTCWFFAIDIDDKDWNKAVTLRREFMAYSINVYITASKSKGFHVYGFADDEPFIGKEVRELARRIELKLGFQTEIFPKQDKLDATIPLGNYINLPCHGFTRKFLTANGPEMDVAQAVKMIQRNTKQAIQNAFKTLPEQKGEATALAASAFLSGAKPKKSKKHPPCCVKMLNGVSQGARDVAAFALARHYLDQQYTPEEVLAVLKEWDLKNTPPLADEKAIETKIKSAEKGYAFGCNSVIKEPALALLCVGKENCEWLKKESKERKKKGLIVTIARFPTLVDIVEEKPETPVPEGEDPKPEIKFMVLENGKVKTCESKTDGPTEFVPPGRDHMPYALPNAVKVEEYIEDDNDKKLFLDLVAFFKNASELPTENHYNLVAWWSMHTYLYDRFEYSPILAFIGAPERGKSRCGRAITSIAYRGIETETVREACLFRWSQNLGATIFLDVMDLDKKADRSNSMDILLKRYEAGAVVGRVLYPDRGPFEDMVYFDIYGPTIIATNVPIHYILDSRCLPILMPVAKRKKWPSIDQVEISILKNRLVAFRARHMVSSLPEFEKPMAGRLGDIFQPIGQIMKMVSPDYEPQFRGVMEFIFEERQANKSQAPEAKVLMAIELAQKNIQPGIDSNYLLVSDIAEAYNNGIPPAKQKSPDSLGRVVASLGFKRHRTKAGRFFVIDNTLLKILNEQWGLDVPEEKPQEEAGKDKGMDLNI